VQIADQVVSVVGERRADEDQIGEAADARAVARQQPQHELLRGDFQETEVQGHAAARVEHDDDGDRLDVALEHHQRRRLAVVGHFEVLL